MMGSSAQPARWQPANGVRLSVSTLGSQLSTGRSRQWRHPWHTSAEWLPMSKQWVATVVPGFVNGVPPVVRVPAGVLREAKGTFYGQLVDAKSGADEIAQLALLAIGGEEDAGVPDGTMLDVPLTQRPPVPLSQWRMLGWYGEDKRVPLFFQDRGVQVPGKSAAAELQSTGTVSADSLEQPAGNRLLAACDVMIAQPRAALTSQITINPAGGITGDTLVGQTLGLREPAEGQKLRVRTGKMAAAGATPLDFRGASALLADYEEKTWDDLHISTVYLLSPPDANPEVPPDSTWQAFAEHRVFWNLHWAQPKLEAKFNSDIFKPLVGMLGVIGGGAGLGYASYVTASINDATQSALNILTAKSLAGHFWTPTGGGTVGEPPAAAAPAPPAGVDKAKAAAAKAQAAAAERRARRLDPAFPHTGITFQRTLLQ
jgi:hypothetical protein